MQAAMLFLHTRPLLHVACLQEWILHFQKSDEGWGAAICILADGKHAQDVQVTASQALKVGEWPLSLVT